MASTASASPLPYDVASDEETWAFLEQVNSSPNTGSVGFLPSPMSGSMGSYGIIGYTNQAHFPSPSAPSPLQLDAFELPPPFPQPFQEEQTSSMALEGAGTTAGLEETPFLGTAGLAGDSELASFGSLLGPEFQLTQQQLQELAVANLFAGTQPMLHFDVNHQFQPTSQLDIPQQLQSGPNEEPWSTTNLKANQAGTMFIMEGFHTSSSPIQSHTSPGMSPQFQISPTISPRPSQSPRSSTGIKQEGNPHEKSAPISIRRVQGQSTRVQKKKKGSSSGSSSLNSNGGTFMIVTPDSITAQAGKPNQYDCFDVSRTSHKGRKGPLGDATKENALQVRRVGACFCCHARKVKCDAERPCKNCKKMMNSVPQLVCWQFHDFLTILFPGFLREHFRKDDMVRFFSDHIESFTVGGVEKTCTVELFSGPRFAKTLIITAKLFTAKTSEVLRHWHLNPDDKENFDLREQQSAPLGLDLNGSQRDEVKKKTKAYIEAMTQDVAYVEQVTDAMWETSLPRRMLEIATQYCRRTDSLIVRKALAIFTMQYFMSRHLCLTPTTVAELVSTNAIPSAAAFTTARVLNRQIKAIVDELLQKEMQALFDAFSRSLKPKMRKEWAPCTAAFMVLCLFMEQVETAADTFAITQRQEAYVKGLPLQGVIKRATALSLNREIEAMPYRQFAHQFHQVYQTHSRDAATRAFNPIFDEGLIQSGDVDDAGAELARGLRELLEGDSYYELDYLTTDPMLPNDEVHPFPCNIAHNYLGRLSSKFLLSFKSEAYIFGPHI